MLHKDTKEVITRIEAINRAFGYQGGTVHDICKELQIDAHDFIYKPAEEYSQAHKAGWFAYNTNSLEFNQENILDKMKGNLQFWIGICDGVQTCVKLGKETPKKF